MEGDENYGSCIAYATVIYNLLNECGWRVRYYTKLSESESFPYANGVCTVWSLIDYVESGCERLIAK